MHQQGPELGGFLGQNGGRFGIEPPCQLVLRLGFVDRGVGGGVDDDVRPQGLHRAGQTGQVVQVATMALGFRARMTIQRRHFAQHAQCALQLPADLPVFAQQQDFHAAAVESTVYCLLTQSR